MQQAEGLPLLEVHTFGGLRLRLGGETIGGVGLRQGEGVFVEKLTGGLHDLRKELPIERSQ